MFSGVGLNSIGDYFGNPDMKWEEKELSLDSIEFTGLDKFILEDCKRSPLIFKEKISKDKLLKIKYENLASFGDEPIIVKKSPSSEKYRLIDGVHRLIGAAIRGKTMIWAWVPLNEDEVLPFCEPHTIYDLIRGFQRRANDKNGEEALYFGLKLLTRCYGNASDLLKKRFNKNYVNDSKVQKIIQKVLKNNLK